MLVVERRVIHKTNNKDVMDYCKECKRQTLHKVIVKGKDKQYYCDKCGSVKRSYIM